MRPTLTPDQRHLLAFVGRSSGGALLDAFLEERALRSLLARAGGASGPTAPHGAPDWMTSYWTVGSKFISPGSGLPRITVTATQIQRHGQALPTALRREIDELRTATREEQMRTWQWCRCPYARTARNAHSGPCPRYHPSEDEDREHYRRTKELREQTDALLRRVLDLDAGAQLDLFDQLI
ncbi:hypothetical protein ACNUDN_32145 (plasmid) [Mycobacterium sp. smrl_JER01]|uniref:hypothetical protein n=1 Tax=Mycobacterium sp. smrl_JER01 TaxID=3402633 RepID=UPI003AC34938